MNFKPFKRFCTVIGVLVAFVLITTPIFSQEPQVRHRGLHEWLQTLPEDQSLKVFCIVERLIELHTSGQLNSKNGLEQALNDQKELESMLSPEQLNSFRRILTKNDQLSRTYDTCGDCYWPNYMIYKALSYIEQAIASYNSSNHYCEDYPPPAPGMPAYDYVITSMEAARSKLITSESQSWYAYQTCNCTSATNARANLQMALTFIGNAISESLDHCDDNPPWLNSLYSAQTWGNGGLSGMDDCVDQACN